MRNGMIQCFHLQRSHDDEHHFKQRSTDCSFPAAAAAAADPATLCSNDSNIQCREEQYVR